jgi:hypothetical protein
MWLQWLAHLQLSEAAAVARDVGLRIGLYLDLAVGEAMDGSATWSDRDAYIADTTVGSPPDPFATEGQDWPEGLQDDLTEARILSYRILSLRAEAPFAALEGDRIQIRGKFAVVSGERSVQTRIRAARSQRSLRTAVAATPACPMAWLIWSRPSTTSPAAYREGMLVR